MLSIALMLRIYYKKLIFNILNNKLTKFLAKKKHNFQYIIYINEILNMCPKGTS